MSDFEIYTDPRSIVSLDNAFDVGQRIDGACTEPTAVQIGCAGANEFISFWHEAAGDGYIKNQLGALFLDSAGVINVRPSGDVDDYIRFYTLVNIPSIMRIGGAEIYLESDDAGNVRLVLFHAAGQYGYLDFNKATNKFHVGSTPDMILESQNEILMQPNGDTSDYLEFQTAANETYIRRIGGTLIILWADGATVDLSIGYTTKDGNLDIYDNGSRVRITAPGALAANYQLTLPLNDGNNLEVLQTNGSGVLSFERKIKDKLAFGAECNALGGCAIAHGCAFDADLLPPNIRVDHVVAVTGTITTLAWTSQNANNTTVMKIWVNAVLQDTITLTGATGVITGRSVAVTAGDVVYLEYDAGQAPLESTWELIIE